MNEQLYTDTVAVLQKLYPLLPRGDLDTLLDATGIKLAEAFPWHDYRTSKQEVTQNGN